MGTPQSKSYTLLSPQDSSVARLQSKCTTGLRQMGKIPKRVRPFTKKNAHGNRKRPAISTYSSDTSEDKTLQVHGRFCDLGRCSLIPLHRTQPSPEQGKRGQGNQEGSCSLSKDVPKYHKQKKMDDYTQPKDAKNFVWGTSKSSKDLVSEEEEEEHYSEPYQHMPGPGPAGLNWKTSPLAPSLASSGDSTKIATPSGDLDSHSGYDYPPPPVKDNSYHCLTLNGAENTNSEVLLRVGNQDRKVEDSLNCPAAWEGRRGSGDSGMTGLNWRGKPVVKGKSADKFVADSIQPGSNPSLGTKKNIGRGVNSNSGSTHSDGPALYEDAWDTVQQQRKREENLRLARSISSTSEKFEDALEFLPEDWTPTRQRSSENQGQGQRGGGGQGQRKAEPDPVTGGNYEKAWDLNRNLEEKLRLLQMHPPDPAATVVAESEELSNYMEPWDTAKMQRELEEKVELARTGGDGGAQNSKSSAIHHHHQFQPFAGVHPLHPPKFGQVEEANYEEAWDTKRGLSQILQAASQQSESQSGSPKSTWSSHHSSTTHCTIGEQVNAMIPLQNQDWYHGNISRDDAEKQLVVCKDGSYLLRDSSDRCHYTLSIKSPLQMIHIQIDQCQAADGSMRYVLGKNGKAFRTVPAMIDHYTQHPVPIRGAEHMTLLHPVQCHWSQANDDTRL